MTKFVQLTLPAAICKQFNLMTGITLMTGDTYHLDGLDIFRVSLMGITTTLGTYPTLAEAEAALAYLTMVNP